jgi:hypothetical protein
MAMLVNKLPLFWLYDWSYTRPTPPLPIALLTTIIALLRKIIKKIGGRVHPEGGGHPTPPPPVTTIMTLKKKKMGEERGTPGGG